MGLYRLLTTKQRRSYIYCFHRLTKTYQEKLKVLKGTGEGLTENEAEKGYENKLRQFSVLNDLSIPSTHD